MRAGSAAVVLGMLGFLTPGAVPAQQGATEYRITGVVLSEHGGGPVAKCHMTAALSGTQVPAQAGSAGLASPRSPRQRAQAAAAADASPATDTDANGRFQLTLPSAGSWQLYASARGYRSQGYERHEGFYFSAVVLTPSQPTYDLVFRAEPDSAIAGFVHDEAGDAVRNARLTLYAAPSQNPDIAEATGAVRGSTTTDDRGHYEFAGLAPGEYVVSLQAEPWYAAGAAGRGVAVGGGRAIDPALDVVYPLMWFPGVSERAAAEVVSLHHGESRQADLNLTPIPATHLRLSPTVVEGNNRVGRGQSYPQVERVSPEGAPYINLSTQIDPQGQMDVGGLSPGLYKVSLQGQGGPQTQGFVRVTGGAQRVLDLSAALPIASLTLHFEGEGDPGRLSVVFTDVENGSTFVSFNMGNLGRRRNAEAQGEAATQTGNDRKLDVPPGRYRVVLNGDADVFLSSLSVKGTPAAGRILAVAGGSTTVNVAVSRGRAAVRGITSLSDKPRAGAMVMLVPATMGQAGSMTILRRDQTNTDGSFAMENVIPGDYILLAIEDGWTVNWHDPSTLDRYLVHGVPVSLGPKANVRQDLVAQTP